MCANGASFVVNPISPRTNAVGSNLALTLSVSPLPENGVWFGHGGAAPANSFPTNAFLDSSSGNFVWVPNTNQLGANSIIVWAYQRSNILNSNYTTFTVTVTNPATPVSGVVIDAIAPQTVAEGTTLTFTNHAHAIDNTNSALVFSLINAPAGASITNNSPTSAVFTWTPTVAQAVIPIPYVIREMVTEPSASVSNYQDFLVTVTLTNNCAQYAEFLAAVAKGGPDPVMLTNCQTIVLTNTLTISNDVTLDGGAIGVTIAGNSLFRLFTVLPGVTFTLRGITLSGGLDPNGGGLYVSPGASVVLTNCTFFGNRATGASGVAGATGSNGANGGNGGNGTSGGSALGGAIYNQGNLTALGCQFLTNSAAGGSGGTGGGGGNGSGTLSIGGNGGSGGSGAPGDGGAIFSAGSLWLSNCTFFGNSASGGSGAAGGTNGPGRVPGLAGSGGAGMEGLGAAVYSANNAVVLNCTFAGNIGQGGTSAAGGTDSGGNGVNGAAGANSQGGGLCNLSAGFLTNCTFVNNQVTGGSGGNGGTGTATLAHGGNGGNGGSGLGGGLFNAGSVVVVNCTFSGGSAAGGTNGAAGSGRVAGTAGIMGVGLGGTIVQSSGTFILRNSILAASSAGGNAYDSTANRITDAGYNISSDASLSLSGTSLKNTDPKLTSLAANGGLTQTMALQTNSPALDKIPSSLSPPADQRGLPRPQPQGGLSDIGAYELVTVPAILTPPQDQAVVQGSNATFTVSTFPAPLTYQWWFNVTNLLSNATNATYTAASVDRTNAGNYGVVLGNSFGSVTSAVASLTVLTPPLITLQPSNQTVAVGGSVAFNVAAAGTAPLSYQWRLNGTNLPGSPLSAYAFSPIQTTGIGDYSVVITNNYGSVTSLTASLSLFISGRVTQGASGLPGVQVAVGTNVTFTDANGYYTNRNLPAGANLLVRPSLKGYAFAPAAQSLTQVLSPNGLNFMAFPSLAFARATNGSFQLAFAAAFSCGVQTSTNLKSWQTVFLTNNISTNTLLLQFTDTNAPAFPRRFYRRAEIFDGRPVISNWIATNHSASLAYAAAPLLACRIEASTNLSNWDLIFTTNLPVAAPFQFRYGDASSLPLRFYRLFQPPGF